MTGRRIPALAPWFRRTWPMLAPVLLAVVVAAGLLLASGANPFEGFRLLWSGSLGTAGKIPDTLITWVPLTLAAAGLVVTFAAGLWNIGIEGQIVVGAIAATWVAREVPGPAAVVIPLVLLGGMIGGALWALLAGALKVYGKVNEIFGGLGLDFVAAGLVVYLVIGPWKRAGVASTSGTDLFRPDLWLPEWAGYSWLALGLTVLAVVAVYLLMRGTSFGLRLKAVGSSPQSAHLLGIPTGRFMLSAFAVCGALAGLAGAVQATGFHHKLVPAVSGGYGFLGILVVLLAAFRAKWIAPIALFFVAVSVGATQLSLRLELDSAIGGVLQGILVLFTLLAGGFQVRRMHRRQHSAMAALVED
ncbi:MAG: ABC transporter permease [Actinobacteria bacterium]|nr:ABC transporter permease [Actinomycetota bacterium]